MISAKNNRKLARGTAAALNAVVRFVDSAHETVERETRRVAKIVEFFEVGLEPDDSDVREELDKIYAECRSIATDLYCLANTIVGCRDVGAVVAEANKAAEREERVVALRRSAVALLVAEGAR